MNVVPFLCPMALNLHQKRPSSVTFGRLFHRAIRREIAAPSFVLMAMVQQSYPRHPPFHRAIRRESAAPSSVLMAMVQQSYPHHPPFHRAMQREIAAPSSVLMSDGARKLPLGGCTFFHSSRLFPVFGNSVVRRGSRLRVAFACIVGENSVKEKWTMDDFRHP